MTAYKKKVAHYYNSNVKSKIFKVGDLVLRRADISQLQNQGKLVSNWKGPYEVVEIVRLETST